MAISKPSQATRAKQSAYDHLLRSDLHALRVHQEHELRKLLGELRANNAFYQERLAANDVTPDEDLLALFERLPLLHKRDLVADQEAHPPFGRNATCGEGGFVRFHQTSGTSGEPLRWPDSSRNWDAFLDSWEVVLRSSGLDERDRIYVAFSFGPFIGFWGAFEAAQRMGALALSGGAQTSEQRLNQILGLEATALICTPTYALRLAEVGREQGIDLASSALRVTLHAGEPGASTPSIRKQLETTYGARCVDHAGATEVGAWGYPAAGGLYVDERRFFAELRDPESGNLLEIDDQFRRGELVLTTLARPDRPVVRYCTGDLVEAARPGLELGGGERDVRLLLRGGVLGRVDDMFTVRGVNVYPAAVDALVRQIPGIAEYRVVVLRDRQMSELELEIEAGNGLDEAAAHALAQSLSDRFREHLHLRVPISVAAPGSLPRFELKAKRFVFRDRGSTA